MSTYSRYPVIVTKGEGYRVWDINGKEYYDFLSGISVCNLGHCHPEVIRAVESQIYRLFHISNLYYTLPQIELAELLVKNSFADKVFFCNSGAEANEAAIKLARKWGKQFSPPKYKIITLEGSFHGRTFATMTATGQKKIKLGFEPLVPGFVHVPFNDIKAIENVIDLETCAIMVEPIQGEGGVRIPSPHYLEKLRKICDDAQLLLIFDEVQTGMGRTGYLFAYEYEGVKPDILTLAKSLANGLPIGAMLAKEEIAKFFTAGSHASTFGGNPIACSAAKVVMEILTQTDLLEYTRQISNFFKEKLDELKEKYQIVKEIRLRGLMIGIELNISATQIVKACLEKGFLINAVQENVLRLLPPLLIDREAVEAFIETFKNILEKEDEKGFINNS
ncbi:MAG: aspartate aminotransferase family protein [Candidatus Desulfofervidus auxilii]|nr:aspartate aminotransferase family protein [Candidatus Desulfofervidus auxilii]